jgi:hypothetical protein
MIPFHYRLDGTQPVPLEDATELADARDLAKRRVALSQIEGIEISTVFMVVDRQWRPGGPPLLFETVVRWDNCTQDRDYWRYSTWEDAVRGHQHIVEAIRSGELAPQAQAAITCTDCGTPNLEFWYTSRTWDEPLCEACYAAREVQEQAPGET